MSKQCLLLFVCLAAFPWTLNSQQKEPKDQGPLFPVIKNGKYGFIDDSGKIVIEPQYSEAGSFSSDLAVVKIGDSWGFINRTGKIVIEPTPGHGPFSVFSEGLIYVRAGELSGFMDTTGKIVIQPQFASVGDFNDGMAGIYKDNKWGYIDKTGKTVIAPVYDLAYKFSEGLAGIYKDKKWGYIDKTGKIVINPTFDQVSSFSEGLAWVKTNNKYGYIDKTGTTIIEPKPYTYVGSFSEGLALAVAGQLAHNINFATDLDIINIATRNPALPAGRMFFIDKTGKVIIDLQELGVLEALTSGFSEGLAAIKVGEKWGFIDRTGKVVLKFTYDSVWPFAYGLAKVRIGSRYGDSSYGYINRSGLYVWEPSK